MLFHEIHVKQPFLYRAETWTKMGHSVAVDSKGNVHHFPQTMLVDGLNSHDIQTMKPQTAKQYPLPQADRPGGMMVLSDAIDNLSQDARRNFHERPDTRKLYERSTSQAKSILGFAFDALHREHKAERDRLFGKDYGSN